jgi:hypothetical protein
VQIVLRTAGFNLKQHSVDLEGQIRLHGLPIRDLNFIGSLTFVRVGDYRAARCTRL